LESDESKLHEWFKIWFDRSEYEQVKQIPEAIEYLPSSYEDVVRCYRGFLTGLYRHIDRLLSRDVCPLAEIDVSFLFSVPTTWTKLGLTRDFVQLAREAGFGSAGSNHSVEVSLTEAEAAAVTTFKSQNQQYSVGFSVPRSNAGLISVKSDRRHHSCG
jgi:hypothetical protein